MGKRERASLLCMQAERRDIDTAYADGDLAFLSSSVVVLFVAFFAAPFHGSDVDGLDGKLVALVFRLQAAFSTKCLTMVMAVCGV